MLQRKIEINWDNNSELLAALESLAVRSDFQIDLLGTTFGVRPVNGCADLPLVQAIAPILNNALNQTWVSEQVIAKRISGSVKTLQNLRWRGTGPPFGMPYGQTSRAVRYNLFEFDAWLARNTFSSTSEATVARNGK